MTPLTGSLKVSVKRSGFALLGDASVSVIEDSVGFVVSIVHVYEAAVVVVEPYTASTRKVCEPAANPV